MEAHEVHRPAGGKWQNWGSEHGTLHTTASMPKHPMHLQTPGLQALLPGVPSSLFKAILALPQLLEALVGECSLSF